ncbi:MAG: hypothetical protein HND48_23760 [Chloroflexi bacterium]|nr:hypothetical protein [Chloroflexota bacterium]
MILPQPPERRHGALFPSAERGKMADSRANAPICHAPCRTLGGAFLVLTEVMRHHGSHADDTSATVDAVAQDGLAALRAAAPEREWAVLQTTLGELLARLPLFAALSAVIDG